MFPKQKVTIQDIAKRAKVSISTVSRVLNDGQTVAEAKRAAVLNAMAELNYQPNIFAQGLASGQSMTLGVLSPYLNSPFYGDVMHGVLRGLAGSGYSPIYAEGNWNPTQEKQTLQTLLTRRVDGLIVLGGAILTQELEQIREQIPLIVVGRWIPSLPDQCIYFNNFAGAYQATRYLIEQGHRRIVHITGILSHQDGQERLEGYQQALAEAGIEPDPQFIIEGDYTEKSGLLAVQTLILRGQPFSAVFAGNDQCAYGVRLGLFRLGIRVPDDISIVGFDDQASSAYVTPPLTTVRHPALEMGEAAAQAMLHLLKGKPFVIPEFPVTLVMRESVARHR
jgi:LacI family transcriptional regulator